MDQLRESRIRTGRSVRHREKPPHRRSDERKLAVSDLRSVDAGDLLSVEGERVRGEGSNLYRKGIADSKLALDTTYGIDSPREENMFAFELKRNSFTKASGKPMKMLIDEEMSKEKEVTRPSPSVIAKLMGLDALPTQQPVHRQKQLGVKRRSPVGLREKHSSIEDNSFRMSTEEQQEFKDVFEVLESSKIDKPKIGPVRKRGSILKQGDEEMAFVRQKFMDAKRLSTDEKLQNSKEFSDALEVLDSNKDLFLKFLQEPNSLFTKHFQELQSAADTSQGSHITILKSSNSTKHGRNEICRKSNRKVERGTKMRNDVMHNLKQYDTDLISHSVKEHTVSVSKPSKARYEANTENCLLPTRIVVLKPNLEKVRSTERIVSLPRSPDDFHKDYRTHREFRRCISPELLPGVRDRQKLYSKVEASKHKTKGSREIAREITKHMRRTVSHVSVKTSTSGHSGYAHNESSRTMSKKATMINTKVLNQDSRHFDDWSDSCSPSSPYSTKSSVNMEAKKRLSERWMMTNRHHGVGPNGRCSSTLGEMLALSDREMPLASFNSLTGPKGSDYNVAKAEELAGWDCPLGISSRDGWKDGFSRNLSRARSLPSSSAGFGNVKPRRHRSGSDNCFMLKDVLNLGPIKVSERKFLNQKSSCSQRNMKFSDNGFQAFNYGGEENNHPVREIYCSQEEMQDNVHILHSFEEETSLSESSTTSIPDTRGFFDPITVSDRKDVETLSNTNEVKPPKPTTPILLVKGAVNSAVSCQKDMIAKVTSVDNPEVESLPSHRCGTESPSLERSKEAENPSPVSVLEPHIEEEESSPECFERVCADLRELRMQLQLLKLESTEETYEEGSELMLSDEEADEEPDALPRMGATPITFVDEHDRDFFYLRNVLTETGVLDVDWVPPLGACSLPAFPVGRDVFEKLEKIYSEQPLWSREERMLLFDLINSVLTEIMALSRDPHPWVALRRRVGVTWGHKGLAEEVWQSLGRRRIEDCSYPEYFMLESDSRWLDLGDDVDMIGREIEQMLRNDLLEEFFTDLVYTR